MKADRAVKICHLTSAHPPEDVRIFHKECVSLAQAGYKVFLIAPANKDYEKSGVHIKAIRKRHNRFGRMTVSVMEVFIKSLTVNARLYHLHDPELLPIGLLLKLAGKKVVFDAHEDLPLQIEDKEWIYKPFRKTIAGLIRKFEKFCSKIFNGIVTATSYIATNFPSHKTTVVNNFPFMDELAVEDKITSHKSYVCYTGAISEIRGIKELVNALPIAGRGIRLLLAGTFSPPELENKVNKLAGWDQVDFLGQVNRKELSKIMAESFAGVVTFLPAGNHIHAQPNKMFEYMSAGLPVVSSDFALWRDIIEGNNCGICVDPLDPVQIGKAIARLNAERVNSEAMGANGRTAVLEKYNWEKEKVKLIAFYARLLQAAG